MSRWNAVARAVADCLLLQPDGDALKLITIEPGKRGGEPCIRGLRTTVYDVLGRRERKLVSSPPE